MAKTIEMTPKFTKWVFIFIGINNSLIGGRILYTTDLTANFDSILGIVLVITGLLSIIYGLILFNLKSKLSPKIQVDENGIFFQVSLTREPMKIDWGHIKEITYRPFELSFQLSDYSTETINLETNSEISVDIKRTIRQFASDRQINVVGG